MVLDNFFVLKTFPPSHTLSLYSISWFRWDHIRTTNIIERRFKEVKPRVEVMPVYTLNSDREQFPIEESWLHILVTLLRAQTGESKPSVDKIKSGKPVHQGILKLHCL